MAGKIAKWVTSIVLAILTVLVGIVLWQGVIIYDHHSYEQSTFNSSEVRQSCQSICSDWKNAEGKTQVLSAAFQYCMNSFRYDANGDGTTAGQMAGEGYNSYCEGETHCFNVRNVSCQRRGVVLNRTTCREQVTSYYERVEKLNRTEIVSKFRDLNSSDSFAGACNLTERAGEETWLHDFKPKQ